MPRKKANATNANVATPDAPQIIENPCITKDLNVQGVSITHDVTQDKQPPPAKKRGRRPKGGKIITTEKQINTPSVNLQENIILHLRCSLEDIKGTLTSELGMSQFKYNPEMENVQAYTNKSIFAGNQSSSLQYDEIDSGKVNATAMGPEDNILGSDYCDAVHGGDKEVKSQLSLSEVVPSDSLLKDSSSSNIAENNMIVINTKLHHLSKELHSDNIQHKKSACFWCTYDFDTEVIYIPKFNLNGRYHVYGCFCSPQCATAHLMNEKVDSSIKFERYQLINNLYAGIFGYSKSIKPAPNPYYVLDKFYGNLTINEFRQIMNTPRSLVIIDKPMTHVFPELYEDNDDFIVSKRTIPKNNSVYSVRKSTASSTK